MGSKGMAELLNRVAGNVDGKFFVDVQCIDCDLCRMTAPRNFKRNEKSGFSFVFKQPTSEIEEEQCLQAVEECPVDAIGAIHSSF